MTSGWDPEKMLFACQVCGWSGNGFGIGTNQEGQACCPLCGGFVELGTLDNPPTVKMRRQDEGVAPSGIERPAWASAPRFAFEKGWRTRTFETTPERLASAMRGSCYLVVFPLLLLCIGPVCCACSALFV